MQITTTENTVLFKMSHAQRLQALIDKFDNNISHYQSSQYNETQLRTDFLDELLTIFGWDITNKTGRKTNEREVLVEEGLKTKAGENTKKPDYTFRLFSERKFFVEAKKPSVKIFSDPEPAKQLRRYGFTAKLKISVLSNFEYTSIYDCSNPVSEIDAVSNSRVKTYHYKDLVSKYDEISRLIGKESVYSGQFEREWSDIGNRVSKFSIDNLFLDQINRWRVSLAREFLKLKPGITSIQLNDLTQNYINSIVFLRVCEDRDLEEQETLYQFAKDRDIQSLLKQLKTADKKYNAGLFSLSHADLLLSNTDSTIWEIIEQLYFPLSTYSFSVLSSDILGNIYEVFLSEKIVTDDSGTVSLQRKEEHIDRDVVTTPDHIVKEIIRHTITEHCKNKTADEILDLKFADIACGSGAFLLETFQTLQDLITDYYIEHDRSKLQQLSQNTYKLNFPIKRKLLTSCIYGIDKDYNAVKACTFGLLLKLLEGETKATIGYSNPLLPCLDNNIFFGNSIIEINDVISDSALDINPFDVPHEFDVIIGNPPYMATEHMAQLTPIELNIYKKKYQSAYKQFDKYFLFVERSIQLLKHGGVIGYILPSKFTKVASGRGLRKLISEKKYLHKLISFGSNQVFKEKTTYTCLLFLKKSEQSQFEFHEVRDFKAWLTRSDRSEGVSRHSASSITSDTWILESETNQILEMMHRVSKPLGSILGEKAIANGIQTSANEFYIHKKIKSIDGYTHFSYKGKPYQIEEALTRPYFETQRAQDAQFYTYKDVEPNSFVVYPYKKEGERVVLIPYEDLHENYPKAYAFINTLKIHLDNGKRSILPTPLTENEWYRYGRSQALENCDVPQKIIVGILSNGYKYSIDNKRTFVSSGGTAGYSIINIPASCKYSIYYIQAMLSSKYLEWFASHYGEIFRGGFIARGTKVQTRMPIPIVDFDNAIQLRRHDQISEIQRRLNELHSEIVKADDRESIVMKRQFHALQEELNSVVKELFNLGVLDSKIPSVKELYEAL